MKRNITHSFSNSPEENVPKKTGLQSKILPSGLSLAIVSQFARSYHVVKGLPVKDKAMLLN